MNKFLSGLKRWASPKKAFIFLALFILNAILLGQVDKPLEALANGEQKLDLRFGYDRETVERLFSAYGEEGRSLYGLDLLVDTPFPIFGAAATVLFVLLAFEKPTLRAVLVLPPLLFAATDLIENVLLFGMARSYPSLSDSLIIAASFVTQVKRSAFYISVVELVISGLILAAARLTQRLPAARTG